MEKNMEIDDDRKEDAIQKANERWDKFVFQMLDI